MLASALALSGLLTSCAHPHRSGSSTRERWYYTNRLDGLVMREVWKDEERGGGTFLFTDPSVASLSAWHTNQTDLGGGSYIQTGQVTITVDPQTAASIEALGGAVGAAVGAAVKKGVGLP